MGRSVMALAGADAIAYGEFAPDPDYYREIFDEDVADGIIEPEDDFEAFMYRRFEADIEYEWGSFVEWAQERITELWPSFEPVEDEWIWDQPEIRVIARNGHAIVTISEYGGIVALCLGADYDRREFWADPSERAGLHKAWRTRIAERFVQELCTLRKVGTMSNGSNVYIQTVTVPGQPSGVVK